MGSKAATDDIVVGINRRSVRLGKLRTWMQ